MYFQTATIAFCVAAGFSFLSLPGGSAWALLPALLSTMLIGFGALLTLTKYSKGPLVSGAGAVVGAVVIFGVFVDLAILLPATGNAGPILLFLSVLASLIFVMVLHAKAARDRHNAGKTAVELTS